MKKILTILTFIITFSVLVLGTYYYPKFVEKKEMKSLENRVNLVNNYLLNKNSYKDVMNNINKSIATGSRRKIEEELNSYLKNIISINESIINIQNNEQINNMVNTNLINFDYNENINYLKNKQEEIDNLEEKVNSIHTSLDLDFINNIDLKILKDNLNMINEKINIEEETLVFLDKNKGKWQVEDDSIIFNKRKALNEFDELIKENSVDIMAYKLIDDKKAPIINASNLTVYKGNKIDLNSKFKCIDDVDDDVKCKVTGNYDVNKVGNYDIKISATDTNKNTSNKIIKLTVKEKVVNKKPYYIEVIRNQNIVIVYGLDNNNEYKKIVKVFVCSVGKNNKTPTGTYKTSDKAKWGWLVGNVYGQYYTRITGSILFHSVPYFKKAKNQLEWEEYNKLGTAASKGCVRLSVRDVKWIYDNCPRGTTVKIYDGKIPSGVSKPSAIKIDASSPNKGWDPTDPDKNNPWKK